MAAELYVCSTQYNGKSKGNHSSQWNTFDLLFRFTQMNQNYYRSEDNAQTWFWTALVTVTAVHYLFTLIHFLYSINYVEFNVCLHVCSIEKLHFVGWGLGRLLKLNCRVRSECWTLHRCSPGLETCLIIFPYWDQSIFLIVPLLCVQGSKPETIHLDKCHVHSLTDHQVLEEKVLSQKPCSSETVCGHGLVYHGIFILGSSLCAI